MKKKFLIWNLLLVCAVCVGNYFYLTGGGMKLKALCSGGFALLGLLNFAYAAMTGKKDLRFPLTMSVGLFLAMLGDIVLGYDFIVGAGLFAGGHICYFIGGCYLERLQKRDFLFSAILFAGAGSFVLFCPLLTFDSVVMQAVCAVYALIISLMVGKALGNVSRTRTALTAVLAVGSCLFFFSDLMLVFDWFMDAGSWSGKLCMATYYPAELLLAYSVFRFAEQKTAE